MNNTINQYGCPSERGRRPGFWKQQPISFFGGERVSLYNFSFTWEIEQPVNNPDSVYTEPPKEALMHLADEGYLKTRPKHIFHMVIPT